MAFIYDLTDTWNNAGISFNGIKINVTDTASASGSKLLDLQIGGVSKFTVGKTGTVTATGIIESTVGGFKFPDGTVQTTSAAGGGTVTSVSGTGTVSGLTLTGTVTSSGSLTLGGTLALTSANVTDALGYTPYNATNPAGYTTNVGTVTSVSGTGTVSGLTLTGSITTSGSLTLGGTLALTSGQVTDALGFTPYNASNPSGYITASALTPYLTSATAATTYQPLDGDLTAIAALAGTAGLVRKTAANTYSLDTAVYITGITSGDVTTALGYTPYNATNPSNYLSSVSLTSNVTGTLPIANGGTGATTAADALTSLGAYPAANPSGYTSNVGTVTSVGLTAGTGVSVSGGPITSSGSITVTNTAPDQVVSLTAGDNITVTGTYPDFTIAASGGGISGVTSVDASGGTTGLTFSGGPITTSGTLTLAGTLGIANGGTGATDAATALTNLGAYPASNPSGYTTNTGTVTSVDLTAGTGISVSGGPVTSSGAITVTNTAPDQVVSLTGAGTTVVTGTYPNFTVTSNDSATGTVTSVGGTGTVSGLTLTGSVTTSGNLTLGGTLSLTSGDVTTALGFTPYDATNPAGYITSSALSPYLTSETAATTYQPLDGDLTAIAALAGTAGLVRKTAANTYTLDTATYLTGITSSDVTTALGFTPYNATNPSGYLSSVSLTTNVTGTLPIANGGTNATTAADALTSLGAYPASNPSGYTSNTGTVTSVGGTGTVNGITLTGTVTASGNLTLGGTLSGVDLTSQVTGTLPVANGGTGATTLTGVVIGNGTSAFTVKTNPSGAFVGTTDTQTLSGKTIEGAVLNNGYTEEVFAITDGASVSLDPNNGSIQTWTLGANRTPDQANWAAGQSITLMIDDGSAYTITWSTLNPVWETNGGSAPTLALTGYTVIVLWKVGTTIYGARVGDA